MQGGINKAKINYIDNLRVLMTILVVLHHTFISYGGPGSWYYTDKTTNEAALVAMTLFVATNQSFFMGFFFFLSALFTETSYVKKGAWQFITDRLKRLGIPILFYSFVLSPVLNYIIYKFGNNGKTTFIQYLGGYDDWLDPGVLWFVVALLVFTLIYAVFKQFYRNLQHSQRSFPSNTAILFFALGLGLTSFLVRIIFPVGWVLHPLGFQLAHFPQYIAMFILGIIASRSGWLNSIDFRKGKQWLITALLLVFVVFPLFFILADSAISTFQGNGTWQSFIAAMWEQLTGISIMVGLAAIAQHKWNFTTPLLKQMARCAFATYIFHPAAVVSISLLLKPLQVDPALKLIIAAPLAVIVSFSLAGLIVKVPVVNNIV